jgi:hypothetical protein
MLRCIRDWIDNRRQWRRMHDAAWVPVLPPGPDGVSPFLRHIHDDVLAAVPSLALERSGESETFFRGVIPGTSATLYLYSDGAQIHDGPDELFLAEYYDYETPQQMTDSLLARIRELQPNNSFKGMPLRGTP